MSNNSIPVGTADIYGTNLIRRLDVIGKLENVYQSYGFEPLVTPTIEIASVFGGHHGEGEKIFFRLKDKVGQDLILRYDLTVPLARFISSHPEICLPFKRYQFAQSFRDDDVDHGHFREFIQCDGDIIGDGTLTADAEIINIAHDGLQTVGFPNFIIRLNHRQLIKGLAEYACGPNYDLLAVQRALDFADKTIKNGLVGVKQDLLARGITPEAAEKIISLLAIQGSPDEIIGKLKVILKDFSSAISGLDELEKILSFLSKKVRSRVSIDLTLARGADYYTGFILEGKIPDIKVGAVLGGGRYDGLVGSFGGNSSPATGMAFGLDRIITALNDLGINDNVFSNIVLVACSPERIFPGIRFAEKLRKVGFKVNTSTLFATLGEAITYAYNHGYVGIAHNFDDRPYYEEFKCVKLLENNLSQELEQAVKKLN